MTFLLTGKLELALPKLKQKILSCANRKFDIKGIDLWVKNIVTESTHLRKIIIFLQKQSLLNRKLTEKNFQLLGERNRDK